VLLLGKGRGNRNMTNPSDRLRETVHAEAFHKGDNALR
jgi:hypothetical protein